MNDVQRDPLPSDASQPDMYSDAPEGLYSTHDDAKAQFGKTAANYVTSPGHAQGAELAFMVKLAADARDLRGARVLDIATGGGHTALAFAKAGADVVATDLTPKMLDAARAFAEEQGHTLTFTQAAAETLPFESASFDFVTCRIAAHHFADPRAFLRESARVLKAGGRLMLVDNIAPTPPELARVTNHIEKVRDPSHVEAYSVATWLGWFAEARLELLHFSRWRRQKDFHTWLERAQTAEPERDVLEAYILSLPESFQHYLQVEVQGGALTSLVHEAALFVGTKLEAA